MSPKNLCDSLGQLAGPKGPGLQVPNLVGSVLIDLLWVKLHLTELKVKTYLEVDLPGLQDCLGLLNRVGKLAFPLPRIPAVWNLGVWNRVGFRLKVNLDWNRGEYCRGWLLA